MSAASYSSRSSGGNPISTAISRPHRARPGWKSAPDLGQPNMMVLSAATETPGTAPVVGSTPEGMSRATIGRPLAFMRRMTVAAGSRGSPVAPVPRIPSTSTLAPARAASAPSSVMRSRLKSVKRAGSGSEDPTGR